MRAESSGCFPGREIAGEEKRKLSATTALVLKQEKNRRIVVACSRSLGIGTAVILWLPLRPANKMLRADATAQGPAVWWISCTTRYVPNEVSAGVRPRSPLKM